MQVCFVCASMSCICKHPAYLPACCVCTRTVTNDASMCVRTQLLVELATATPNATIRVTSDGSDPSPQVSRTPVKCFTFRHVLRCLCGICTQKYVDVSVCLSVCLWARILIICISHTHTHTHTHTNTHTHTQAGAVYEQGLSINAGVTLTARAYRQGMRYHTRLECML